MSHWNALARTPPIIFLTESMCVSVGLASISTPSALSETGRNISRKIDEEWKGWIQSIKKKKEEEKSCRCLSVTLVHEAVSMETTIVKSIKSKVFPFTKRRGGSVKTCMR